MATRLKSQWRMYFYNGHEADLNCTAGPQKSRDFDEYKKSICYFVKSKLFLINFHEADPDWPVCPV